MNNSLQLTKREKEILSLISYGLRTKDIAQKIYVSVPTVETHRRNLFQKLHVNNVALLIRKGFESGLL